MGQQKVRLLVFPSNLSLMPITAQNAHDININIHVQLYVIFAYSCNVPLAGGSSHHRRDPSTAFPRDYDPRIATEQQ
jgi:hypothetical protein